jgi:precorrin-4/cobalt-precorrin-4 C11-methyltransferase
LPELCQTIIVTRAEGRTPMPETEKLEEMARHQATMAFFLSINLLAKVARTLTPHYGADCPVAVVHKASWPDQRIVLGTLADIFDRVREAGITSQAIILVGRVLTANDFANSRLYDPAFKHNFRGRKPKGAGDAPGEGGPRVE